MLDRASTFANPQIVKLLQTRFIPVAIDQAYQRRQKDAEGEFYRKIAMQGPRKPGRGTTQGLYAAAADGKFLGFTNNRGAERVMRMLNKSLQDFRPTAVAKIEQGKLDPRYNPQPPKGGLVVRVHSKVLDGYEPTEDRFRQIFQKAVGRDNLWIRADEHQALLRGQFPDSLLSRIARYHLVDNTRGEPPMWEKSEIRSMQAKIEDGQLVGSVALQNGAKNRAFNAKLFGYVESKNGKLTRLDVVARGQFRGHGPYTQNAPKGWFPLAIAFSLADGSDAADGIPPQGSRGWVAGYVR